MDEISIITDQVCDLPQEIIEKHQIKVVPFTKIYWPEGENLPGENIFQKMREAEKLGIETLPKTSQPSPLLFKELFQRELKKSTNILCITMSSKLSGTYNSAIQAKKLLNDSEKERIFIIDSLNLSAGQGLLILKAIDLIKQNKTIEEISKEIRDFVPKVHLFGMVEAGNIKYFERSGRFPYPHWGAVLVKITAKFGIQFIGELKEGILGSWRIEIGRDMASILLKKIKKDIRGLKNGNKKFRVAITHCDNLKAAKKLKEILENNFKRAEVVFLNLVNPIIGVHLGPGTLIVAWSPLENS